jgi:5-methylcytosine-specific restriction endonuclease McrA
MDAETKRFVRTRASQRCEYCGIHQRIYPDSAFHIEHIVARQHGGGDEPDNLALSCHLCNSKKGPNLSGLDPKTGVLTRLFILAATAGAIISAPKRTAASSALRKWAAPQQTFSI